MGHACREKKISDYKRGFSLGQVQSDLEHLRGLQFRAGFVKLVTRSSKKKL
jgi:hypothetical protein